MRTLVLCCTLALVPACNDDNLNGGTSDLSMSLDMTPPVDMTMRVPNGVMCGTAGTCNAPKVCCIVPNASGTATDSCVDVGGCQDGGVSESCDGPEDCSNSKPDCCVTASFTVGAMDMGVMAGAAGASCAADADCPASATFSGSDGTINTKLCHTAADCTNYSGMVPILGTADFSSCCTSPMTPGIHFCSPSQLTSFIKGATCN